MSTFTSYNVLYFGCWYGPGHYLWTPKGIHAPRNVQNKIPWKRIDGALQPESNEGSSSYHPGPEPEGEAALHQKDGWTCIAFWDRSVDKRRGSNSSFFVQGTFNFEEVVRISKTHFPSIWNRFLFEVTCVEDNGHAVPDLMTLEEKAADYDRITNSLKLIITDRNKLLRKIADLEADIRILGVQPKKHHV